MTFRQRLNSLIKPLKKLILSTESGRVQKSKIHELIFSIKDYRDYFTHNGSIPNDCDSKDILGICFTMEGILQIIILLEIGFSQNDIENMTSFRRIKKKLDHFPYKIRD